MPPDPHRVTVNHLLGLSVDPAAVQVARTVLVDTTDGVRLVTDAAAGSALNPGSTIRRLLTSREDLAADADYAGMTLNAYIRAHGARIAADLNRVMTEDETPRSAT
jgi:predicted alpha/beta-hydrolase family hydrolase